MNNNKDVPCQFIWWRYDQLEVDPWKGQPLVITKSKKQMCLTKLSMKHLYKYPNVIEFVWYHQEHTCEDGTPGHGTLDCDSQSCKFWYANYIFLKLKAWIQNGLNNGLTTRQMYE
jgi:hypothetical protein